MADLSRGYLLPRNSLLWLLLGLTVSLLPMLPELPLWLPVVWIAVLFWRLKIFRGHWNLPNRKSKVGLVCVCVGGLYFSYGRLSGLEPMVALLACAVLLKLLEMYRRRDALVVIYLGYFLIAVQFLFAQTLLANVYGAFSLWLMTTALLVIYQPQGHLKPKRSAKLSARLLLHTFPLMVLLFLVMPRIDSIWSVPTAKHTAKTGVSDSMTPGDFTKLTRSGGVAFRASFEGAVPDRDDLYWRGLVFSYFDGRSWQVSQMGDFEDGLPLSSSSKPQPWLKGVKPLGKPTRYEIIMEASQQPWLYSLQLPVSYESNSDSLSLTRDFRLLASEDVSQRMSYQVSSHLEHRIEADKLEGIRLSRELRLPKGKNPQALEQAQQWYEASASRQVYIDRVLTFFNERFSYTLEPPRLGLHSVDDFLFGTQQGFCEHFASAFVVMMRAAGIPARVVAGYQGGEYNPLENYIVVHQYDAHAWAEVWLSGRGWVRVDPTAAVAPERVMGSLGDLQTDLVEGPLSLGRYRSISWLNSARLQWDAINYRWYQMVMGFDDKQQVQLLNYWLNGVTALKMILLVLLSGGLLLGLISLHLWWSKRPLPVSASLRAHRSLERLMLKKGFVRRQGETSGDFIERVALKAPLLSPLLQEFRQVFEVDSYAVGIKSRGEGQDLMDDGDTSYKSLLREIKQKLRAI